MYLSVRFQHCHTNTTINHDVRYLQLTRRRIVQQHLLELAHDKQFKFLFNSFFSSSFCLSFLALSILATRDVVVYGHLCVLVCLQHRAVAVVTRGRCLGVDVDRFSITLVLKQ